MKTIADLNPAEIVAISKAIASKDAGDARDALTVGDHDVDVVVRVSGTLSKGEDHTKKVVAKADPWTLLAVALSHLNGVTVDSIVREALTSDPELVKGLKDKADKALVAIKAPTETKCAGQVRAKVTASVA